MRKVKVEVGQVEVGQVRLDPDKRNDPPRRVEVMEVDAGRCVVRNVATGRLTRVFESTIRSWELAA